MKKMIISMLIFFLFFPILYVNAESFSLALNIDQTSYTYNDEVNLKLSASGLQSYGLSSAQFYLTYDANYYSFSCNDLTFKQNIHSSEIDCNESNGKIIILYVDGQGGDSPIANGEFINVLFKVKKSVTTTITTAFSLSGDGFAGVNNGTMVDYTTSSNPTKSVSIVKEKDSDTYLKSISIKGYTINFSKNKYEYSIDVENEITSITIDASTNNSSSSVSGTGTKNLSVGDNKFTLTVSAENGEKQNYIINVNRKTNEKKDDIENNVEENNNGNEDEKIDGTVENSKTGVFSYLLVFMILIIISGGIYFKILEKNKFPRI